MKGLVALIKMYEMKNKIIMAFLLLFGLNLIAQNSSTNSSKSPKLKFESEVIDYGTIKMDSNQDREFKFVNTGKELLVISNAQSSCGCLAVKFPREPIMPGKSGVITAHYDTKRVGRFEKTITVTSNDIERPTIVLKIKGNVLPPPQTDSAKVVPSPK